MKIIEEEILKQLSEIKDNGKTKQERQRAHAILLSNDDIHVNDIAKIFDVTTRSIFGWFKAYNEKGISSLRAKNGRGRKLLLDTTKHKGIIEKNIEKYPHQPKTAYAHTMTELNVKMSYDTFKRFLKKHSI